MTNIMVFDVESNGLHGEGFAVGWVCVEDGVTVSQGYESCAIADPEPWVTENVLPFLPPPTQPTSASVRDAFWFAWMRAKAHGYSLWADCGWPVEANFLSACVADAPDERSWDGPYPLHEISTVFRIAGWDESGEYPRLEGEDKHHPVGDAKQSARLLLEALNSLRGLDEVS